MIGGMGEKLLIKETIKLLSYGLARNGRLTEAVEVVHRLKTSLLRDEILIGVIESGLEAKPFSRKEKKKIQPAC